MSKRIEPRCALCGQRFELWYAEIKLRSLAGERLPQALVCFDCLPDVDVETIRDLDALGLLKA